MGVHGVSEPRQRELRQLPQAVPHARPRLVVLTPRTVQAYARSATAVGRRPAGGTATAASSSPHARPGRSPGRATAAATSADGQCRCCAGPRPASRTTSSTRQWSTRSVHTHARNRCCSRTGWWAQACCRSGPSGRPRRCRPRSGPVWPQCCSCPARLNSPTQCPSGPGHRCRHPARPGRPRGVLTRGSVLSGGWQRRARAGGRRPGQRCPHRHGRVRSRRILNKSTSRYRRAKPYR
jgi:hypothetical protein